MSLGPWQLIIIALVILVLFGRGRISEMMGDFGKGIKSFKQGMNEEDAPKKDAAKLEAPAPSATDSKASEPSDAAK
ncbi:MAG: twin-arginine translocase TatA/TatE family subunit [Sphingomonadaceae bacterium]